MSKFNKTISKSASYVSGSYYANFHDVVLVFWFIRFTFSATTSKNLDIMTKWNRIVNNTIHFGYLKKDNSWLVSLIIAITRMVIISSILKHISFWCWWTIIFVSRMWSYVGPIFGRSNRAFTNWTILMITFMISYEIRMNCQVTLIALIFFQNCSKYSTIMHNKDVLISTYIKPVFKTIQ